MPLKKNLKLLMFAVEPLVFACPPNPSCALRGEEMPFELFQECTADCTLCKIVRSCLGAKSENRRRNYIFCANLFREEVLTSPRHHFPGQKRRNVVSPVRRRGLGRNPHRLRLSVLKKFGGQNNQKHYVGKVVDFCYAYFMSKTRVNTGQLGEES